MRWLRSLAFNIAFILWTITVVVAASPMLLFGYRRVIAVGRFWSRGTFFLLRHLVGIQHRIDGLEHRPDGPAIYAVKHQSTWDTMAMADIAIDAAYILKRELVFIPLFGLYLLRGGFVPVNRQRGGAALRAMLRAAERIKGQGRSIVIYPEGTRVAPGETRPFHPGVAALYAHLHLPVVPVALNSGLFWGRRRFTKQPGTITLRILPPIPAGLDRHEFMRILSTQLADASHDLLHDQAGYQVDPMRTKAITADR